MYNVIQTNTKKRTEFLDITQSVKEIVANSNIRDGIVLVYTKHTTTGLSINENEEGLIIDMEEILGKLIPKGDYRHDEIDNNADSHLKSLIIGQHLVLPIKDLEIELGTWQRIFFIELDGPRSRSITVKVVKG